ncbi:MAG: deoxyuridine 5'-triphosphate nucleotidohydrolase [Clostridiales bacterium]|nr:deoxyuridine 5'-triphosphate nucleotidohydrolase [Clostridiales bacterium]
MNQETIRIYYHSKEIDKLTYIAGKSDWIDLRAAENAVMKKGEFRLISLGISMCLPDGYEAIVAPRSSTFKNFGIIMTNSLGIIDESYGKHSTDDIWKMPVLAMRDTEIHVNDRIAQFRIQKHQPQIIFEEAEEKQGEARGGFGSSGIQ